MRRKRSNSSVMECNGSIYSKRYLVLKVEVRRGVLIVAGNPRNLGNVDLHMNRQNP